MGIITGIVAAVIAASKKRTGYAIAMGVWTAIALIMLGVTSGTTGQPFALGPGLLFVVIAICMKKAEPDTGTKSLSNTYMLFCKGCGHVDYIHAGSPKPVCPVCGKEQFITGTPREVYDGLTEANKEAKKQEWMKLQADAPSTASSATVKPQEKPPITGSVTSDSVIDANTPVIPGPPPTPIPPERAEDIQVHMVDVPYGRNHVSFGIGSNGDPCTVGRTNEADVVLNADDGSLSRRHFTLVCSNGNYFISDAGSTQGTYLNGMSLTGWTKVNSGDHIRAGGMEYMITFGSDAFNQ